MAAKSAANPPALNSLDVSYGAALCPHPFKRWVREDGQACNINPAGSTAVFLWTRAAAEAEPCITSVTVVYDDEEAPPGFRRVARDLSVGVVGGAKSYLAYRTATSAAEAGNSEGDAAGPPHRVVGAVAVLEARDAVPGAATGTRRAGMRAPCAWAPSRLRSAVSERAPVSPRTHHCHRISSLPSQPAGRCCRGR